MSKLLLSPIVWRLFMQIVPISFLYPSSSKCIFTKATKCVVRRDSWLRKSDNCFFSHRKSDTKTKPGVSWIHVWSSGGVYRDFFTFKAFKECLPHFHSTQFSLLHDGYKCFSINLSYFDEKTETVSFLGKNLSMSDLNTMLYHYRWPHNDVTVTCTYHFDNGIVLGT